MSFCWPCGNLPTKSIAPGISAKVVWGDRMMLLMVTMEPGAVMPSHHHPHEQMGLLVEGSMELAISDEICPLSGKAMYLVPAMAMHASKAGPNGAVVIEAFSPPREEYK
jgi:quercetin dioxygenase-like cupin family protein